MTKKEIVKKITDGLVEGGYSTIYDFVESHISKKDIKNYDNESVIADHGTYQIISDEQLEKIEEQDTTNMITDTFDLKIGKKSYRNSISSASKVLDLYKHFCELNGHETGNLYIGTLENSKGKNYFTLTDAYSDDIFEEFDLYCQYNEIDLYCRDFFID